MKSLRNIIIVGVVFWVVISTSIGGLGTLSVVEGISERRFNAELQEGHVHVAIALARSQSSEEMETQLSRPSYYRPFSGVYWQATREDGLIWTSRSLVGSTLPDTKATPDLMIGSQAGPDGDPIRYAAQNITLEDGSVWSVVVTRPSAWLANERSEVRASFLRTLAIFGLSGIIGAILLVVTIARPLTKLREDIAHRWDQNRGLDSNDYPTEVAPLVQDIKTLLDRNRDVVERSRRSTADLAHSLKTPTTILKAEIEGIAEAGYDTTSCQGALERLERHIDHSLARMRTSNAESTTGVDLDVSQVATRFVTAFERVLEGDGKQVRLESDEGAVVRLDRHDLEEAIGNLLDNARKWCSANILLAVAKDDGKVVVSISDDGPGIPEDLRTNALEVGRRLDTSAPGTGLGLSIVSDLVAAYGGSLDLGKCPRLGGLRVQMAFSKSGI